MFRMAPTSKFLGIIPARYASTRFPGKPLVNIQGKTMIQCVYEQASKALETVYVATDDERIVAAVQAFNGRVVMTSPQHKSGTDRCAEAALLAEQQQGTKYDVVLNVQGDEPFIEPQQLELITMCFEDAETQIATLVKKAGSAAELFDPNRPKVAVSTRGEALYFSRAAIPFIRGVDQKEWFTAHDYYTHIGMYGFRRDVLHQITDLPQSPLELAESLEQLRWIENGYRISVRVTTYDSFGIDTPEDLMKLQQGNH
jgi:3-deoxy-manno-octulosonate cytidylyltransferase (CMP-KDO synthetase)